MGLRWRTGWACGALVLTLAGVLGPVAEARAARTFGTELTRLTREGAVDRDTADLSRQISRDVRATVPRLSGARRLELGGALRTVEGMAARGAVTPSRLPALALTLERNREWWTTRELLRSGARVAFPGSELVWQMIGGQGLQLHPLANFGKLNALWATGKDQRAGEMLDELLPLAAQRAGGLAWEYYFAFGGGQPPWVSGLAQGTALQSMARVATKLGRQGDVFPVLAQGLGVFATPAPEGVAVATPAGTHYALYSFAPGLRVLNGFVQSLVGLFDYAQLTGDPTAQALYQAGEQAARVEVPLYDTGGWSLYSRGTSFHESDLSYHVLLRDFMNGLCRRTAEPVYCVAEAHFTSYLITPPAVRIYTPQARARTVTSISFDLSKMSRVGMVVSRDGRPVYSRAATTFAYGRHSFAWPVPRQPGVYTVRIGAKDLAGNAAVVDGAVRVLPAGAAAARDGAASRRALAAAPQRPARARGLSMVDRPWTLPRLPAR
jgi:hypothetical protein